MRLPHAVRTLCVLLQDSNSHVRNACLRHKAIDVLLPYAASARVMAALHAVAAKPAGRKDLARVSAFFREAVVVDNLDDDLKASMYRLLGVISPNVHAESTPEYVATLVSLALRGKVEATVAVALIRRASVDVLEAALGCVDAGLAVSPPADPLMLHLAMRSNALAALVAQRHGPSLVGRLIATGPTRAADDTELANLSTLIHAVVLHLSPAAFDEKLAASAVATSHGAARLTMLRLLFHFIQLPGQTGALPRVLRSSAWPTFLELLVGMVETMLADQRRFEQRETLGASILLAIASSATKQPDGPSASPKSASVHRVTSRASPVAGSRYCSRAAAQSVRKLLPRFLSYTWRYKRGRESSGGLRRRMHIVHAPILDGQPSATARARNARTQRAHATRTRRRSAVSGG